MVFRHKELYHKFNLIYFSDEQDEDEAQEIPLPNVKSSILAKVIEYIHHYRTEPMNDIEKVNYFKII
jgi:hypothetical protein